MYKEDKGSALVYVMILLVCGMTLVFTVFSRNLQQYKVSIIDREISTASYYANNAMTDIMRQFSQDPYGDHYTGTAINRSAASFENGFSEVDITSDESAHTLFIEATGKFGKSLAEPNRTRRLTAVIKFISDMTAYGTYLNQNFTTSASNVVYNGKMWINGNWNITGSNVSCAGGPVFVKNNITGNITINGDLYYGGSMGSGINVLGNAYNYFPLGDYPAIDTEYYEAHYNVKYTDADEMRNEDSGWPDYSTRYVRLNFNSDGTITVNGGASPTITIPSSGLIIYGEDCNIRISGTLHGRVTVMADRIKVRTSLNYANGTDYADEDDSFAALAKNRMYFRSNSGIQIHGAYFLDSISQNIRARGRWGTLELYGTRNRGIQTSRFSGSSLEFDPYLNEYPPPGLPENPKVVTWRLK